MAGERLAHLAFGGRPIRGEELGERHQYPRRAVAALQAVLVPEGQLQRVELALGREAFDGAHFLAVGLHRQHEARTRSAAVDKHGAGAAHAVLAAQMRTGELQLVAQEIRERHP